MLGGFCLLDKCTVKSRLEAAHEKIRSNGSKAIFLFLLTVILQNSLINAAIYSYRLFLPPIKI